MKRTIQFASGIILCALVFSGCEMNEDKMDSEPTRFKVTIENILEEKMFFQSGIFNTPVGASEPGGAGPGNSYEFTFHAGLGSRIFFATMFVQSNDLFYAPSAEGIELYDDNTPISGDITHMIKLWDAGTEINEEPGIGPNQPLNGGAGVGETENSKILEIGMVNDGFSYPIVADNIKVSVTNDGGCSFTVKIENLDGSSTPIAPGVFVVHSESNPLFEPDMADMGYGLENLAEDGDPSKLADYLSMYTGYSSPLAPGVWTVHNASAMPLFTDGEKDYGFGLEALAENGDPSGLSEYLVMQDNIISSGIFNTPSSEGTAGPLTFGKTYIFEIDASEGDYLSFATMLVHSNDLFYAPSDKGIALFNGSYPVSGDITSQLFLWDAGTEINEFPGAGIHQPARLNGGQDENGYVMRVSDGYSYPEVSHMIKVTINPM